MSRPENRPVRKFGATSTGLPLDGKRLGGLFLDWSRGVTNA
jgi:hypothetical protein